MKYDDASWHYNADNFPKELPLVAGATHTGMFVVWGLLSGLAGDIHEPPLIEQLMRRSITPGRFFLDDCDGKFTDEDLNDEGNAFARAYFDFETGEYLQDYESTLGQEVATLYHVADTWENYDLLKPVLDQRFSEWRAKQKPQ